MTNEKEHELKPCPFCGSEAHIVKVKARIFKGRAKTNKCKKYYCIGCSDPDCILHSTKQYSKLIFTVSEHGLDTMIRRWNRRDE